MSSTSASDPRPLGTWLLATSLSLVHLLTAWVYAPRAGISVWEALFLVRPTAFRELAGGQNRRLVRQGEIERLVRSIGLHADALHLLVNIVAIVVVGRLLEPLVGTVRLLSGFVVCGVAASLASYLWGPLLSDGASGGAFGLLGMLVVVGVRERGQLDPYERSVITRWIPLFVVLNLVLSVLLPFVDLVAHLAGLAVGLALGWVPRSGRIGQALEFGGVVVVVVWASLWW